MSTSGILCSFDLGVSQPDSFDRASSSPVKVTSNARVLTRDKSLGAVQELSDDEVGVVRTGRRIGKHTQLSRERRLLPDPTSMGSFCD